MTGHKETGTETKKETEKNSHKGTGSEVKTKRSTYNMTKTQKETESARDIGKETEEEIYLLPIFAPHHHPFTHLPLRSYLTSPRVL